MIRTLVSFCAALLLAASSFAAAPPPNIIFLLTDDQRADSLGCMGHPIVKSPNIDRLAAEGVVFDRHYVTTAICAVSRASILSGQYARRNGINDFSTAFTPEAWAKTYPAILRAQNNYRTGFIGKYGVGDSGKMPEEDFDYWDGFGAQGYYFPPDGKGPRHLTPMQAESAVKFLETNPAGKPFCLSISFKAPHVQDGTLGQPFLFDPALADMYADVTIPPPPKAALFDTLPDFLKTGENRSRWERWYMPEDHRQASVKAYYRLISGVDQAVGEIRAALDRLGLAGNTIIIYSSDNGMLHGEWGLAEKWLMYEESIRVPLIICDPRQPKETRGRRVHAMTLNIDLAPTMLDFAGAKTPDTMQGRSLRPWVEYDGHGPEPARRSEWYYEHHFNFGGMIAETEGVMTMPSDPAVTGPDWKYLRYVSADPPREELYNLPTDPGEEHNLATDPAHAADLQRLRARWSTLREDLK